MRSSTDTPTALAAAILTALCLLFATCSRLPVPGPVGGAELPIVPD